MERSEIAAKVIEVVKDQMDKEAVTEETDLRKDLGADSLDAVEIIMGIEDAFEIEVPDEETEKVKTVKDAVDLVVRLTS